MGVQTVMGAMMLCSFGTAPCSLVVLPANRTLSVKMPAANIMDYKPVVNLPTFAMCTSMANPATASATSAASGVLTPTPCVPVTAAPWVPGAVRTLVANMPALSESSKCFCSYGGVISITFPGQVQVMVN